MIYGDPVIESGISDLDWRDMVNGRDDEDSEPPKRCRYAWQKPQVTIDAKAPWRAGSSTTKRERPGVGRYLVDAEFVNRATGERMQVRYWLPADTGKRAETGFHACAQIINSRRDPREFEGMELPDLSVPVTTTVEERCHAVVVSGAFCEKHAVRNGARFAA